MIVRFPVDAPFTGDDAASKASGPEVTAIKGLWETFGMPMLEGLKAYMAQ